MIRHALLVLGILLPAVILGCGKRAPTDLVADDGSAPPRIRHRGELRYPDVFPSVRGRVEVLVTIGSTGSVIEFEIVDAVFSSASNSELFIDAARQAAETTSFTPSLAKGGYPQTSKFRLNYYFKLSRDDRIEPKDVSKFDLAVGQNVDVVPKLVHAGFAARPLEIWQATGHVELEILVDASGRVYGTKVLSSTLRGETAALMHRRVRDAARRHQFEPAMKDGEPVPCRLLNWVTFEPIVSVYARDGERGVLGD